MKPQDILYSRLLNHGLSREVFSTPAEVVTWFGAMQAQDYPGAKWAIALRIPGATDETIEQAIDNKEIVRSWSLRGTWHFMSPEDIRWILQIAASRIGSLYASYYRKLDLDKAMLSKCCKVMEQEMKDGSLLTREEIAAALQKKKIVTQDMRLSFILLHAALHGLICHTSRRKKSFTFGLLDEWIPAAPKHTRGEAIEALTKRYFISHGPATVQDFAWWSGLTVADSKKGIEMAGKTLITEALDKTNYYLSVDGFTSGKPKGVFLLPGFDEYFIAYKNRNLIMNTEYARKMMAAKNGLYSNTIVIDGIIAGTWRRTINKDNINMELNLFEKLTTAKTRELDKAIKEFGKFAGLPVAYK
jgi:hypothetical protein